MGLPRQRVGVWQQAVSQLRIGTADGLDARAVGPRHVLAPHPAVRAEDRAKGAELEPARVELAGGRHGVKEPAHVSAPVRHPGHAGVEPQGDLGFQRPEVVVDVTGPGRRAEALHAGGARAAEQEHPLLRTVSRLAGGERLVAEAIVDVVEEAAVAGAQGRRRGRALAAVQPPARHAEPDQLAMRRPPPGADRWVGEVEVALALAIVGAGPAAALVARVHEIAARFRLGEDGGLLVQHRVLVGDDLEVLRARLAEQRGGILPERGLELEVAHAAVPAERLAVAREIYEGVARDALLANGPRKLAQFGGVVEMAGRLEEAQRPARRQRRAPEQVRDLPHHPTDVVPHDDVPGERTCLRGVRDTYPVVRASDREGRVAGIVEEQRVAARGDEERDAHVRAGPVAQVAVPELAGHAEAVELAAPLSQPVEMLLAGKREADAHTAPAARVHGLGHAAVGRLPEHPLPARVEQGEPERPRRDLDLHMRRHQASGLARHHVERCVGPLARGDVGRRRRRAIGLEPHPDDARRHHRECHIGPISAQPERRSLAMHSPFLL